MTGQRQLELGRRQLHASAAAGGRTAGRRGAGIGKPRSSAEPGGASAGCDGAAEQSGGHTGPGSGSAHAAQQPRPGQSFYGKRGNEL